MISEIQSTPQPHETPDSASASTQNDLCCISFNQKHDFLMVGT